MASNRSNGQAIDEPTPNISAVETGIATEGDEPMVQKSDGLTAEEFRAGMLKLQVAIETAVNPKSGVKEWLPWASLALVIVGWALNGIFGYKNNESTTLVELAKIGVRLDQIDKNQTEEQRLRERDVKNVEERIRQISIELESRGIKLQNP
jgi:hypothetical protein